MKKLTLSKRLEAVAGYIRQGSAVADIGTDHGYIPVYLAQNSAARRIVAADVRKGPLMRAQLSAEEYGVGDRIELVRTDGLDGLRDRGLDTVVIAGMGGETIAGILARADWTRTENVRLILQPQTKLNSLLSFLSDNGYHIRDASLALDGGRRYAVILAGAGSVADPRDFYTVLLEKREPLLPDYLAALIAKTRRAVGGLKRSARSEGAELEIKERELGELIRLKKETDKWRR